MRARNVGNNDNGYYGGGGGASPSYGSSYGGSNSNNNAYSSYGGQGSTNDGSLGGTTTTNAPKSSYTSGMPLYSTTGSSKSSRRSSSSSVSPWLIVSFIVALLFTIMAGYQRWCFTSLLYKLNKSKSTKGAIETYSNTVKDKQRAEGDARYWQREVTKSSSTMRKLEGESRTKQTLLTELNVQHASKVATSIGKSAANFASNDTQQLFVLEAESKYRTKRELAWQDQVYILQNATQRESYRAVIERFGNGPHKVLFTLELSPEEIGSFIVELAPLGMLPHANHLFLEQVYHELWDGTYFFLNGPHVLQAGPQDWSSDYDDDDITRQEKLQSPLHRFQEARLETLTFPEYSPQFPHKPWTLGFTGRPGGPDWYINKVDNTPHHGPHGQAHHPLNEQADSCFAHVVQGREVLEKIFKRSVHDNKSEFPYLMHDPVEIISARVVNTVEDKIQKPKKNTEKSRPQRKNIKPQRTTMNQETRDEKREKKQRDSKDKQRAMEYDGDVYGI